MKFDYSHYGQHGCYLYNTQIHYVFNKEELEKQTLRTYRFFVKLIERPSVESSELFEEIDFIATLNLKDYCYKSVVSELHPLYHFVKDDDPTYYINFDKIVDEFFDKEKLDKLKSRLKRRIENKHREPTYLTDVYGNDNVEFLEFEGLSGYHMEFGKQDSVEDLDFTNSFRLWMLSGTYDEPNTKRELFHAVNRYKQEAFNDEQMLRYFDYIIHLYGTDDDSYSKGFHTEEEMMEEVQRLRNNQPLSMSLDLKNGYVFTN